MEISAVQAAMTSQPSDKPSQIISLSDIVNTIDIIKTRENDDRTLIKTITQINEEDLRNRLVGWGAAGFPDTHKLYTLQFNRLEKCSDGVIRNDVLQYFQYLEPEVSIVNTLNTLEARLPGMALSYSYTNDFIIHVHVSRK